MKKLLLLSGLILGTLNVNAQLSCAAPRVITAAEANGTTLITTPVNTGTYVENCFGDTQTVTGGAMMELWYTFTPDVDGTMTVSSYIDTNVAPKSTNTTLNIFTGTSCAAADLTCVAANDDVNANSGLSVVTILVTAGTKYFILWDNYYEAATFDFVVNYIACSAVTSVYNPINITTTSAELAWEKTSSLPSKYDISWSVDPNVLPGAGNVVSVDADTDPELTYTTGEISGITPAESNFKYFLRGDCDGIKSVWNGPYYGYLAKTLSVSYSTTFDDVTKQYSDGFVKGDFDFYQSSAPHNMYGIAEFPLPANYADGGIGNCVVTYNDRVPSDYWAFSRGLNLTQGEIVTISFKTRLYSESGVYEPIALDLTAGTGQNPSAQTEIVNNYELVGSGNYVIHTETFTAPTTDTYYFGFNNISPAGSNTVEPTALFIDSITYSSSIMSVNDFLSNQFKVYPNPVKDIISLSNTENIVVNSISITDLNGRVVRNASFNNVSEVQVNVSDLASGMYLMTINSDKGIGVKKITKQ